jgi:hypothetical protein
MWLALALIHLSISRIARGYYFCQVRTLPTSPEDVLNLTVSEILRLPYGPGAAEYCPGIPAISLFRVCRQIHEEAASTFYKNNVFRICWTPTTDWPIHDVNGYFSLHTLVPWITALGKHAHLLRKVEIDIDTICPIDCQEPCDNWTRTPFQSRGLIEVGRLLSMIWSGGLRALDFTFISIPSVNSSYSGHFDSYDMAQRHNEWDLSALSSLLRTPLRDAAGIAKYWRTIGNISLERDGSGGVVTFWSTSSHGTWELRPDVSEEIGGARPYLTDSYCSFNADADGTIRMAARKSPNSDTLGKTVRYHILGYAMSYQEDRCINMDDNTFLRAWITPNYVNREWQHFPSSWT